MLTRSTPALLAQFKNQALKRGIRNNNPGNIDYNPANDWRGQLSREYLRQTDPAAVDPRFAQFEYPEFGIRAIIGLLRTYQSRYNLHSAKQLIGRWAPPNENDTKAYVASVVRSAGLRDGDQPVNLYDKSVAIGFAKAIVLHENGMDPYDQETYDRAFGLLA